MDPRDRRETCRKCPRRRGILVLPSIKGKPVDPDALFGEGPLPPSPCPLLLVGRDPGKDEAEPDHLLKRAPFVGAAGRLLDLALQKAGLSRLSSALTNTCLCHIPGNPPPTEEEMWYCRPLLMKVIEAVKPRIVVALGGEASLDLLGPSRARIMKWHGSLQYAPSRFVLGKRREQVGVYRTGQKKGQPRYRWREMEVENPTGLLVMPALHPSFVLRSGNASIPFLVSDLRRASLVVHDRELVEVGGGAVLRAPWMQLQQALERATTISLDVETSRDERRVLRVVGIGFDEQHVLVKQGNRRTLELLRKWIEDRPHGKMVIAHNAPFDLDVLRRYGVDILGAGVRVWDTMQAAHFLRSDLPSVMRPLSLEQVASRLPHYAYWNWKEKFRAKEEPDIYRYNALDVAWTYAIFRDQYRRMQQQPNALSHFMKTLMPLLFILHGMEERGFRVDVEKREQFRAQMESLEKRLRDEWDSLTGGVNPSSTPQLMEYFYGKLGLKVRKSRDTGRPTLDKDALVSLIRQYPRVRELQLLLDMRHVHKILATYLSGEDERVRFEYKLHGTFTGRLSGNGQQIPRYTRECPRGVEGCVCGRIREMYIAEPGELVISADYSNIEARITAVLAGEEWLVKAFESPDFDYHQVTADNLSRYTGMDIPRKMGKKVNHAMNYGMGVRLLARELGVKMAVARAIMQAWEKMRPATIAWRERLAREAEKKGYVTSPFGRRFYFRPDEAGRVELPKVAAAVPQSTAVDICLRAVVEAHRAGITVLAQLHDEIVASGGENEMKLLLEIMQRPVPELDGWFCPAEAGIAWSWGEAKQ